MSGQKPAHYLTLQADNGKGLSTRMEFDPDQGFDKMKFGGITISVSPHGIKRDDAEESTRTDQASAEVEGPR